MTDRIEKQILLRAPRARVWRAIVDKGVDVPHGVVSMARSGSNPFAPKEVVARLRDLARDLHHARAPEMQPQE